MKHSIELLDHRLIGIQINQHKFRIYNLDQQLVILEQQEYIRK